jgi:carboxypeptidase family protein
LNEFAPPRQLNRSAAELIPLKMRKTISVFAVALLLTQFSCIPFGDAWVSFSGHVKDNQGKPISGARLKILFNGSPKSEYSETVTNENGEYKLHENSCPCDFEFVIVAAKDGYKIYTKTMRGKAANELQTLDIVLERQ